ncbi:MAG: hypothetical protein OEY44_00370 [Candidatus Peregrinibacteria bacterium]|nr:hypothetical protein [Candidatus Peregrinibacteria bacterium]
MELSILVAKIASLTYFSAGIAAFGGKIDYKKMVDSFGQSPALTYMTGLFALIIGMILVEHHNIWVMDWPVLVTIIGWASTIKGVMLIAAPEVMSSFKPVFKNTTGVGIFLFALGALFGYYGFLAA